MNPYAELDVPADADAPTIKRAYRKKASKHHPDKEGGDKEKFQLVKAAYELLEDPARRKRYDETGETNNQPSVEAQALAGLTAIILSALDQSEDVDTLDMDKVVRDTLNAGIDARKKNANIAKAKIKKLQRAKARLIRKTAGENMLTRAIDQQIAERERHITSFQEDINLGIEMLKLWGEYEYRFELQERFPFRGIVGLRTGPYA